MLASAQLQGFDLLRHIAEAAASRARLALGTHLALTGCDEVRIELASCAGDLRFEAWCVRESAAATTITAFAMIRDAVGREHIAASGRFTFSVLPSERDPSA